MFPREGPPGMLRCWAALLNQATRMSQSVLVTGGAGYIGSHACKALARAGYRPVVFDNLSRGHREAVRWGPLIEGDLADRNRLVRALETHHVAAALAGSGALTSGLLGRDNLRRGKRGGVSGAGYRDRERA